MLAWCLLGHNNIGACALAVVQAPFLARVLLGDVQLPGH
jgi:hypothetical protein